VFYFLSTSPQFASALGIAISDLAELFEKETDGAGTFYPAAWRYPNSESTLPVPAPGVLLSVFNPAIPPNREELAVQHPRNRESEFAGF